MVFNILNYPIGEVPLSAVVTIMHAIIFASFNRESMKDTMRPFSEEPHSYDFIVVGGGVSGSVLASRLSDVFSVLLIEAGGTPNALTRFPKLAFHLMKNEGNDWNYKMVPQSHANFGKRHNISLWPSGKGLGGSSIISPLIYLRGNVQRFDHYAEMFNDPYWSMNNVLKYYEVNEDYKGYYGGHGQGGGQSIEKTQVVPFIDNYLEAAQELGYRIRDPNAYGPLTDGFSKSDFMVKKGRRWTTYDGFLKPAIKRNGKRLTILKFSQASKILMDGHNTAYGVEFIRHGKTYQAFARKEVILSAGAIQTPKLLMLSGIGPFDQLKEFGIEPRVELPVGQALQDKYGSINSFLMDDGHSFNTDRDLAAKTFYDWFVYGRGTIATPPLDATFTIESEGSKWRRQGLPNDPDMHCYVFAASISAVELNLFRDQMNNREEQLEYFRRTLGMDSMIQAIMVTKPFGYGTVKLRSANPLDDPLIDPRYLQDPRDVKVITEGLALANRLVEETNAFKRINGRLVPTPYPGCEHVEFKSESYWECLARHTVYTSYEYSGTAPMGRHSDPQAVVDNRLRVFYTKNLRIVDGSVLQAKHASINHPTCMMIGRLAADFIIEEYM